MITDRRTRAPRTDATVTLPTSPEGTPPPQPIERHIRTETVKIFLEKCPGCGVLVEFKTLRTSGHRKDVWCPKCGRRHVINVANDTIRPLGAAAR